MAKAYGVVHAERKVPERWTFFIDKDGKIFRIDKKVSVSSHGVDIAKALEDFGVGIK